MENIYSKPFILKDTINYSDDSIVSKTFIDTKVGTITLFSFDKGQKLSEHTAPYDAFVQVLDGKANISIDKKEYPLNAGETIIMPANVPHSVEAKEKFKMLLTMIRASE